MAYEIHGKTRIFIRLGSARREVEYILADQPGGLDAYDLEAALDSEGISREASSPPD